MVDERVERRPRVSETWGMECYFPRTLDGFPCWYPQEEFHALWSRRLAAGEIRAVTPPKHPTVADVAGIAPDIGQPSEEMVERVTEVIFEKTCIVREDCEKIARAAIREVLR